jgi:hypothetical protein
LLLAGSSRTPIQLPLKHTARLVWLEASH